MNERSAFCHEAILRLERGDPAALGAAITVELCGHWEHEGACRWPHHTAVLEHKVDRVRIRTIFAASPDDEAAVRASIREALAGGRLDLDGRAGRWLLLEDGAQAIDGADTELARRLASAPT